MPAECRFCLGSDHTPTNPLLRPCDCKGSSRYVHKTCIQTWRNATTIPKHISHCQLCLTKYNLPVLELLPEEPVDIRHTILFQLIWICPFSYFVWFVLFVALNTMFPRSVWGTHSTVYTITASNLLASKTIVLLYIKLFLQYVEHVEDKRRYFRYWIGVKTEKGPVYLLILTNLSIALSIYAFPMYNLCLIFCLQQYLSMHRQILQIMNREVV